MRTLLPLLLALPLLAGYSLAANALGKDDKAMVVPSQAIIPTARNKQVILLRKDSAVFTVIETGIRDSVYVQVLKGLNVGDTVITSGLMAIRPKSKIKVGKLNRRH